MMRNTDTAIHYDIAARMNAERDALRLRTRHLQAVALNEFRNSYCDLFGLRDLAHYQNATGKDMRWLLTHARFRDRRGMLGTMAEIALRENDLELVEMILLNAF